jgi:GntR family transcriptional regulator
MKGGGFMAKYQEIAEDIHKNIVNGKYKLGEQLALEKEMCVHYGVSRITIKRAVDELVNMGLVVKRRGSGTFVKSIDNKEFRELSIAQQFTGFSEVYRDKNIHTELIRFDIVRPTEMVAEKLQITTEDFVYNIIRVRHVDGKPIVVEYTQMPIQLILGIKKEILENSIYAYIQEELRFKIQSAHRNIRAVMPNQIETEALNIQGVLPLLEVEQVAFLDDGQPFEYSICRHRGDESVFRAVSIR